MGEARRKMETLKNGHTEACSTCRFYLAAGNLCRHSHPIAILVGMQPPKIGQAPTPIVGSYFPQTRSDGWCGEYEAGAAFPLAAPIATAEQVAEALAGIEAEGTA